jgi:eukaryotic-like serine/threonine-protein kinase
MAPLRGHALIPSLRAGDLLDHYRLETLVASTVTAFVFRASDTHTGRTVAIKTRRSKPVVDWLFRVDLDREIEINRRLDHPGIAKVFPAEKSSHRYAVIEWIHGRSLRQVMEAEKISVERAVNITQGICGVLNYVHSRGIIHLDLKPENVFLESGDRVKLIDFGIARRAGRSLTLHPKWRKAGSPDYASPEQIKGKHLDGRSDLYSLGVILYEMLAGEVPFSGVDPATALSLRLLIDPVSVREVNPDVPEELAAAVSRAIARTAANRYPSVSEFADALDRVREAAESQLVASD